MIDGDLEKPGVCIGDMAPNFQARTTAGLLNLSDFRGRWLVMFSHPADFTPVCTSEFMAFSKAKERFDALNCALLALSVDSLFSHLGWIRAIRDGFGVEVNFPIVEDPTMVITRAYGMVGPCAEDAGTMRATFIIDPDGIVRAMSCYPATIGRSVDEIIRTLQALQRVDRDEVVTPEGWHPGDDVLLPPHCDQATVLDAENGAAWFYRTVPDEAGDA